MGWNPPLRGVIKLNSDVAVRGKCSYLGIVARNEKGDAIEAHTFKVYTTDPLISELMAVKEAILLSLKNSWTDIICESDAKNVIQWLNGGSTKDLQ